MKNKLITKFSCSNYVISSAYDYIIPPKDKILALTDIRIEVPNDTYGRIAPRSGLAHKHFIDVGGIFLN